MMSCSYLLDYENLFSNMLNRAFASLAVIDEKESINQLVIFESISDLAKAIEEKLPDILLVSEAFQEQESLALLLEKTHENCIDNVLLTSDEKIALNTPHFDSYLSKYDTVTQIHALISRHLSRKKRVDVLNDKITESMDLTSKTLEQLGDLGEIQQIYYSFTKLKNIDELIEAILSILESYKVNVVLMVKFEEEILFYSNTGKVSELDRDIIEDKKCEDRFVEFGVRTQVNYESISALIKNMPRKNTEQYTRIKDNMVSLLSTCDTLIKLYEIFNHQSSIGDKIGESTVVIREMVEQAYESQIKIMNDITLSIEQSFYTFGLAEYQESEVISILNDAESKTSHLHILTKMIVKILAELKQDSEKVLIKEEKEKEKTKSPFQH